MPNFDEISQSTAKIKLLPVSQQGRPPYWNCTSDFDFYLFIVIGKSFCISLFQFCRTRTIGGEVTSYPFFKMAATESEIYFRFRFW